MTEREYRDVISLLHDYEITDNDAHDGINGGHIARLGEKARWYELPEADNEIVQ